MARANKKDRDSTEQAAEKKSAKSGAGDDGKREKLSRKEFEEALEKLEAELVKVQLWVKHTGAKIIVVFEGRDAAGKGGVIKRIMERVSPRVFQLVALPAPTEREKSQLYMQRYLRHFPAAGEVVLFDRSWYNRAGVERVMGFCTKAETREFLKTVPQFEKMLIDSGTKLLKYYLDITKAEQKHRLKQRRHDPLAQWKLSPVDLKAPKFWRQYSKARNEMFERSHTEAAPWTVVRADDKEHARLNVIRDLLWRVYYPGRHERLALPDPDIVFAYEKSHLADGMIAP